MFVSLCIITDGSRISLKRAIESALSQKLSTQLEIIVLITGNYSSDLFYLNYLHSKNLLIFYAPPSKGFSFYRNQAIRHSNGDIVAFLDDDEFTDDENWLSKLITPIIFGQVNVTTSGYIIPLGQSYTTDCISLFGYPGGGALGFSKVWRVNKNSFTFHICSGNFSFRKSIFLNQLPFDDRLIFGCEDVYLGEILRLKNEPIFFLQECCVYHEPRSLSSLFPWIRRRYVASVDYFKLGLPKSYIYGEKFHHLRNFLFTLFSKPLYIPGCAVIFLSGFFYIIFLKLENLFRNYD